MTSTTKPRRTKSPTARVDIYQQVTDRVMEMLEAGTAPWRKPWNTDTGLPLSLSTHKPYRGVNVFLLGMSAHVKGYRSPWWGTYKKIVHELGGQVRGGEKATHIIFWGTFQRKDIDPVTGKPATGMVLRDYSVFNSEQADWPEGSKAPVIPDLSTRTTADRIAAAEAIAAGYPAGPTVTAGRAAYYRPDADVITIPPFDSFGDPETYYSTLFHEQGHSTGHKNRLNRAGIAQFDHFGSERYGKEELVAEMTAALLSGIAGLTSITRLDNTAAYLASWLDAIREDRKLIVVAAAAAQKAADHILGVTWDKDDTDGASS